MLNLFRRRRREDLVNDTVVLAVTAAEARIEDLKAAHAQEVKQLLRLVEALAEQIEFLRSVNFGPPRRAPQPVQQSAIPDLDAPIPGLEAYVSDEEAELAHLVERGDLSERDMEAILARAGIRGAVSFDT